MMVVKFTISVTVLLVNFIICSAIADDNYHERLISRNIDIAQNRSDSLNSPFDRLKGEPDAVRFIHHKNDNIMTDHLNVSYPIVPEISGSSSVQLESSTKIEALRGDINQETEFIPTTVSTAPPTKVSTLHCCNRIIMHCCISIIHRPSYSTKYESKQRNYTEIQQSAVSTVQLNDLTNSMIDNFNLNSQSYHQSNQINDVLSIIRDRVPDKIILEKYHHIPVVVAEYFLTKNSYQNSTYEVPVIAAVLGVSSLPYNQQYSSKESSSSSTFYSSNSNSQNKQLPSSNSLVSGSVLVSRIVNLNQNTGVRCIEECIPASSAPIKTSYAVSTSFSRNISDINGHKTENREASVTVNDNGKVDTYNTHS